MPLYFLCTITYKDGTQRRLEGFAKDVPLVEQQLRRDPDVKSYTIDYES